MTKSIDTSNIIVTRHGSDLSGSQSVKSGLIGGRLSQVVRIGQHSSQIQRPDKIKAQRADAPRTIALDPQKRLRNSGPGLSDFGQDIVATLHDTDRSRRSLITAMSIFKAKVSPEDRAVMETNLRNIHELRDAEAERFFCKDGGLKISAGTWKMRFPFNRTRRQNARKVRQMVRAATLAAYCKTGDVRFANRVKHLLLYRLMSPSKADPKKTELQMIVDEGLTPGTYAPDESNFIDNFRQIRDMSAARLSETGRILDRAGAARAQAQSQPLQLSRAVLGPGDPGNTLLRKVPDALLALPGRPPVPLAAQQQGRQAAPGQVVVDPNAPGPAAVMSDIAHRNDPDKRNEAMYLKPVDFGIAPGSDDPVSTENDHELAKVMQDNAELLHKVTKGQRPFEHPETVRGVDRKMVEIDAQRLREQVENDRLIAGHMQDNAKVIDQVTRGRRPFEKPETMRPLVEEARRKVRDAGPEVDLGVDRKMVEIDAQRLLEQIDNDRLIAEQAQDNADFLDQVTEGQRPFDNFDTNRALFKGIDGGKEPVGGDPDAGWDGVEFGPIEPEAANVNPGEGADKRDDVAGGLKNEPPAFQAAKVTIGNDDDDDDDDDNDSVHEGGETRQGGEIARDLGFEGRNAVVIDDDDGDDEGAIETARAPGKKVVEIDVDGEDLKN